jgi:hypothetical protein
MDVFFLDDSESSAPTRPGMRAMVAAGGVYVPSESLRELENEIEAICTNRGFPSGEEFKWSPGRELWMRSNVVSTDRADFFKDILDAAVGRDVRAVVVMVETKAASAIHAGSPGLDATFMLLERANNLLTARRREALVIADEPSGGAGVSKAFVAECVRTLKRGTKYVPMDRLHLVVAADSRHTRLLQLADLVTGCVTAYVSGEPKYSPTTFISIKPMLRRGTRGQIGGNGLKIHPDFRYVNLYHWLLGDNYLVRGNVGHQYPLKQFPYAEDADTP